MHLCWHSSSFFTACAVVKINSTSVSQLMADHTGLCYTKVPGLIADVPPPTVVQELHYPRGVGDWGGPCTPQPDRAVTGTTSLTWKYRYWSNEWLTDKWTHYNNVPSTDTQHNATSNPSNSLRFMISVYLADANNKGWAGCGNGLQMTSGTCMVYVYVLLLFMTTTGFRYVTWLEGVVWGRD